MLTRPRRALFAIVTAAIVVLGGGVAYAAMSGGPPITVPSPIAGVYYSGPVHLCVDASNESRIYFEAHSQALGNCAAGYRQFTANEITPVFTMTLGTTTYACSAATAQSETAVTCTAPGPSPSPSASSTTMPAG